MIERTSRELAAVVGGLPGGGETRPGQKLMAEAVARAFEQGRHLVVRAGTGTGKSLAYLVPAVLSGRRVVVATATKALQDQLADKDLPYLAGTLPEPFEFAVLKGRANYLCRQKLREMGDRGDQQELDVSDSSRLGAQVRRLTSWAEETTTGDRAELDFEPDSRVWQSLSVSAMECPGAAKCPSGAECFAERSRHVAMAADIIVTNLHLYGLDLLTEGAILPEHDAVVIDEAHQLEDIISSAAGLDIGGGRFTSLARTARAALTDDRESSEVAALSMKFADVAEALVGSRLRRVGRELEDFLDLARSRIERLTTVVRDSTDDEDPARQRTLNAAGHLLGDLDLLRSMPDSHVVWAQGPRRAPSLRMAPLDVGDFLTERLWGQRTAVLTSATIDEALSGRLGLGPDTFDFLDAGSPFDFGTQGLLYCAMHMPDPRSDSYLDRVTEELVTLIGAAGGRTLCLFTSWRALEHVAPALAEALPFPILAQGELPKPLLVKRFTEEEDSVLAATMGFWQGVDIPGRALSLVTIDRIPFPRPDDPLLQARRERAGREAFSTIDLPRAATLLAQGAGRLIRTAEDRGVVAVLDPRLGKAGYRWNLVRALPPMARTRDTSEAVDFLRRALAENSPGDGHAETAETVGMARTATDDSDPTP
ncbi:MAG TPA: ATP-dependent DNA helicase [Acidimicrobiales bacterium]|nr:ATP-dependent DNA helicase [Acidimicrobiales bacterium]